MLFLDNKSFIPLYTLMGDILAVGFALSHVDEFIDDLLTKDYACDVAFPRVPKR